MEGSEQTEAAEETARRIDLGGSHVVAAAILFFGFGIAAGLLLAFAGSGFLTGSGNAIIAFFLVGITVVAGIGLVLVLFRRPLLRRLFGYADTRLELFAQPLARVAERAAGRDPAGAMAAARDVVGMALARYAWLSTRRWIITSLTALIAAMAALAGTALLFRQNQLIEVQSSLLEEQNIRIAEQTILLGQDVQLAEASRNAALAVEITQIATALGLAAEKAHGAGMLQSVNVLDPEIDLGRALILRIVSVSGALKPYRFLDTGLRPDDPTDRMRIAMQRRRGDLGATYDRMKTAFNWEEPDNQTRLIDRPASPERGQLLSALAAGGVRNLEVLNIAGLDLSFAFLQNAQLGLLTAQAGRLSYADFSGTHLTLSDLGGAMLENARFRRARLDRVTFATVGAERVRSPLRATDAPLSSFLTGADFREAVILDSDFSGARMTAANLDDAVLVRPVFAGADLGAATFRGAVLLAPEFGGASLKSVDLDGAVMFGADPLAMLSAAAQPGSFRAGLYRAEPLTPEAVMEINLVYQTLTPGEVTEITDGAPAHRLVRVQGFGD